MYIKKNLHNPLFLNLIFETLSFIDAITAFRLILKKSSWLATGTTVCNVYKRNHIKIFH